VDTQATRSSAQSYDSGAWAALMAIITLLVIAAEFLNNPRRTAEVLSQVRSERDVLLVLDALEFVDAQGLQLIRSLTCSPSATLRHAALEASVRLRLKLDSRALEPILTGLDGELQDPLLRYVIENSIPGEVLVEALARAGFDSKVEELLLSAICRRRQAAESSFSLAPVLKAGLRQDLLFALLPALAARVEASDLAALRGLILSDGASWPAELRAAIERLSLSEGPETQQVEGLERVLNDRAVLRRLTQSSLPAAATRVMVKRLRQAINDLNPFSKSEDIVRLSRLASLAMSGASAQDLAGLLERKSWLERIRGFVEALSVESWRRDAWLLFDACAAIGGPQLTPEWPVASDPRLRFLAIATAEAQGDLACLAQLSSDKGPSIQLQATLARLRRGERSALRTLLALAQGAPVAIAEHARLNLEGIVGRHDDDQLPAQVEAAATRTTPLPRRSRDEITAPQSRLCP
jgi:hypothetical protein